MGRKQTVLLIILLVLGLGSTAKAAKPPFTIKVTDEITITEHKVTAEGGVVIDLAQGTIKADRVVALLKQNLLTASGDVVLIQDQRRVSGASLRYNYQTQQGVVSNSKSKEDKLAFTGRKIEVNPDTFVVKDASLTPCRREVPHYKLTAKTVTVYPEEKLVATGVWFWVKNIKLYPLFTYKMELTEEEEKVAGDRATFLEPGAGYNQTDGWFVTLAYHQYVNEMLRGKLFGKYTEHDTHRFRLDYTLNPGKYFTFNPRFDYHHQYGWDYYAQLKNDLGPIKSNLKYNSFIERDKKAANYQQRMWKANYQLGIDWKGFTADFSLDRPAGKVGQKKQIKQKFIAQQSWRSFKVGVNLNRESYLPALADSKLEQKYTIGQDWADYYWQLKQTQNKEVNYQPQLTLGTNKQLGLTKLAAKLKTGWIDEKKTEPKTRRDSLQLRLKRDFALTDSTTLTTKDRLAAFHYGTGDNYQSYNLGLKLSQETGFGKLGLDYHYYDKAGATPFKFDRFFADDFGYRHVVNTSLAKDNFQVTPNLGADWKLFRTKTIYETGPVFGQYGGSLGLTYQPNQYHTLQLDYNQQRMIGQPPGGKINREKADLEDKAAEISFIQESDLQIENELAASYEFETNQGEWPYWQGQIRAGYDFRSDQLSTLEYSVTREYDCFNLDFTVDQLDKEVNWDLNFKY